MPVTDTARGKFFALALSEDNYIEMGQQQSSRLVVKGTNTLVADVMAAIRTGKVADFAEDNDLTMDQISGVAESIERLLRA